MITILRSLVFCVALTVGARSGSEISRSTSFVPGRDATGLIVVGIAIDRYDTILGMTAYGSVNDLNLAWTRVENGVQPAVKVDRAVARLRRGHLGYDQSDLRKMAWQVLQVQPGDYQLTEIQSVSGRAVHTTRVMDSAGLVTHVGPGEIVYIGDFTFDALTSPMRIVRYGRNDAEATRVLASYPGIVPGPVAFRRPMTRNVLWKLEGSHLPTSAGQDTAGLPEAVQPGVTP